MGVEDGGFGGEGTVQAKKGAGEVGDDGVVLDFLIFGGNILAGLNRFAHFFVNGNGFGRRVFGGGKGVFNKILIAGGAARVAG